ncbi:MAG: glucose 1-dehydrogenase [Acidimicrobiia bacterium]|nr:glucose 1-dehydrogenase [Acidimicrobiia bacterium]
MNASRSLIASQDLSGRVAVLTGAGSGIGKATALTLAAAGAVVVGGDIDGAAASLTADEIEAAGGTARAVTTDVTVRAQVDALIDRAMSEFGQVDIVANIAGVPHNKLVAECTDEEFERILAINLKSVFYGCQAAMRVMSPRATGNIVNISSGAIDTPAPTLACYGMTKAAVAMLTKTLAWEAGPFGIRVNAIAPGVIETNFSKHNFVDEDGNVDPEKLEGYRKRFGRMTPLGRVGEAQDVADTILYLVSDAAAYMTGQILRPNGGQAMPW